MTTKNPKDIESHTINDMSFTAYLVAIHGFELLSAVKLGTTFRFEVYSDNGYKDIEQLRLKFINSDCSKFDSAVRSIKGYLHGNTNLRDG